MKRLLPVLIIAAFFLGIGGGTVGRLHVNPQLCNLPQHCSQFSIYLPCDDISSKWDVAAEFSLPPGDFVSYLTPSQNNFLPCDRPGPAPQDHYGWLGLGCGGLPS